MPSLARQPPSDARIVSCATACSATPPAAATRSRPAPADALAAQLWLNDRYALDGRSATGYTNMMWVFGKHDRSWFNQPIFGTVRTMTERGMRAKFDVERYIERWGGGSGDTPHPQPALPLIDESTTSKLEEGSQA